MGQILEPVDMVCPFCENVSGLEKKLCTSRALFAKSEVVFYEEYYIHCPGCGADFTPGKMMDENLARARDARKASKEVC